MNSKLFLSSIIRLLTDNNIFNLIAFLRIFFIEEENTDIEIFKYQLNYIELLPEMQLWNRDVIF